jgi:phosphoribosylglycinamide formyltransferase-1
VLAGDTPEALAARVLRVEHEIYPAALRALAAGQVAIDTIKKPPGSAGG